MDSFPEIEIAEYKVFDERYDTNGNTLNISYGIDENYLDGVGVSITSVLIHNDINVAFHIICDNYTQSFVDKIEALVQEHKIKISLYLINVKCLEVLPKTQVWSRAMYFRLFAFDFFTINWKNCCTLMLMSFAKALWTIFWTLISMITSLPW